MATPLGKLSPADRLTPRVDWRFIAGREGVETNGYVPKNADQTVNANSGVTIATGFDLGKRTVRDLQSLGLPQNLINTLTPYVGLRGQDTQDYLDQNPLSITDEQEVLITPIVHQEHYDQVARRYNAASATRLQDLPREAQTVLASLALQYGPNLSSATPNLWKQVVNHQWQDAHDNLRDFGDSWPSRRTDEAALLKRAIDAGKLGPSYEPRMQYFRPEWP